MTRLHERGVPVGCWDPYYAAVQPLAESDLVSLGYVLSVIEDMGERAEAPDAPGRWCGVCSWSLRSVRKEIVRRSDPGLPRRG